LTYTWVAGIVDYIDKEHQSVKLSYPDADISENEEENSDDSDDAKRKKKKPKKEKKLPGPVEAGFDKLLPRDDIDVERNPLDNMITLENINEGNIVEVLRQMFEYAGENCIYCGDVLLYQSFRYDNECGQEKKNKYLAALDSIYCEKMNYSPHLYALLMTSIHPLVYSTKREARGIIFLGESGSGKTRSYLDSLEFVMTCFSPKGIPCRSSEEDYYEQGIEKLVMDSNSVINYLVSARTGKNNSSTRAGKLFKFFIEKDRAKGFHLKMPFLEKNRVVAHNTGETTFHIFRMLAEGMSAEEKIRYQIEPSGDYLLLKKSMEVESTYKYAQQFDMFRKGLDSIGFSSREQDAIWRMLSLMLNIFNVQILKGADECKRKV
jgi:myosin heavy subunit